jgi:hypothetical protein
MRTSRRLNLVARDRSKIGVWGATERNAEIGITFLMSSKRKCGVSGINVLWERTAGQFTRHYPKKLLLSGDRLVGEEDAR